MILVDTAIWLDHLRRGEPRLAELLDHGAVLMHPFVLGEIACGELKDRTEMLQLLKELPRTQVASSDEALAYIERYRLYNKGIGWVEANLLASVEMTTGARLWTRHRVLNSVAVSLGLASKAIGRRPA